MQETRIGAAQDKNERKKKRKKFSIAAILTETYLLPWLFSIWYAKSQSGQWVKPSGR